MASRKFDEDAFIEAVVSVMGAEGVTVDMLAEKAPEGFWVKVGKITGQSRDTARTYFRNRKEKVLASIADSVAKGASVDFAVKSAIVAPGGAVTREDLEHAMSALEAKLTTLLEQRIDAVGGLTGSVASHAISDDPPKPPKVGKAGKKFAGGLDNIRGLIDRNLVALVEQDAQDHYAGNMSRTLTAILWRYYDRPALSFQEDELAAPAIEEGLEGEFS